MESQALFPIWTWALTWKGNAHLKGGLKPYQYIDMYIPNLSSLVHHHMTVS